LLDFSGVGADDLLVSAPTRGQVVVLMSALVSCRRRAGALVVVVFCLVSVAVAGAASSAALPNPCTLLISAHPEKALAPGRSVEHRKLVKQGSAGSTCSETVGTLPVYLSVSHAFGGFGGIKVISMTHPSGLGGGDELVVGKTPTGGPVDFVVFHKSTTYADLSANGANPSSLTTLAREIYKLLH
jgi:hypothetical protein